MASEFSITSIIDVPLLNNQPDQLDIKAYQDALAQFIRGSETPITIAIQGEWGSGKTSLMNRLENELCVKENSPFHGAWVNSWHFALMKEPSETLIGVIKAIINEVTKIIKKEHPDALRDSIEKVYDVSRKILKVATRAAVTTASSYAMIPEAGKIVDQSLLTEDAPTIIELRDQLQNLINKCIKKNEEKNSTKRGFVFFIDDLDRIDPPVAVQILELLKNIFDLKLCVFVLAIDYDVVVKGLKPKFGELTNEREFRSFFDKIIQLPFYMPVSKYVIDKFVIESLKTINFITEDEANDDSFSKSIMRLAGLSVGSNPRSLKRLFNYLSLINLLIKAKASKDSEASNLDIKRKLIAFGLVCLQISYPSIHKLLIEQPNFPTWNEEFARNMNLDQIPPEKEEEIIKLKEFDEEWEKIIFRACINDPYLSKRVFPISRLLNLIGEIAGEIAKDDESRLGEIIGELQAFSSVTDVQASDKLKIDKSSMLHKIDEQLLPLLEKKLKEPYKMVKLQGKKVVSNLYYRFSEKDWEDYIQLELRVQVSKILLRVGRYFQLFKKQTNDPKKDIELKGKLDLYNNVINSFKELDKKYSRSFKLEYSLVTHTKTVHRLDIFFEKEVDNEDALIEDMETLADLITDYMQVYVQMKELRS